MGNAFVLIVVGVLLLYAVISDKFFCLEGCFNCLAGRTDKEPGLSIAPSGGTINAAPGISGRIGVGGSISPGSKFTDLFGR